MKRCICLMITLVLCLSFVVAGYATEEKQQLTIYYGTMREMMEPLINAFMEKYPNVEVKDFRATTEELAATMQMELKAENPQFDVTIIGDTTIAQIKEAYPEAFDTFKAEEEAAIIPGLLDPNGVILPVGMGFYTIAYNTNQVQAEDVPSEWKDLLNEKWMNKLSMADPQSSSAVYGVIWYIIEHQGYGWDYFTELNKLKPNYQGSHGTIGELVNIGEVAAAILPMANVIKCVNGGNPVSYVVPKDGSPTELTAAVLTKGTSHKEAAELFMNFLVSSEGQALVAEYLGYIPVRGDMDFELPGGGSLEGLDLYSRDVAWINEHKQEVIDFFVDLYEQ